MNVKNMASFKIIFFFLLFLNTLFPINLYSYLEVTTLMVPMRDSVRLATDVHLPAGDSGPWPTILIRTPYSRQSITDEGIVTTLTENLKYAIVIQNTRGRFESEGADSIFFSDGWGRVRDGYDTVEWIAQQSWSNGKIGMWGASAYGITAYMAAGAAPPHLTCCLVMVAASNLYEDALFYSGVYRNSLVDDWLLSQGSEHLNDFFIQHPNYESVYDIVNLSTRYDSVNVPILHIGGWHDIFLQGQIHAFCGIQNRGRFSAAGKQKLIVGPWTHNMLSPFCGELTFPRSQDVDLIGLTMGWFDTWLKGIQNGMDFPEVYYYLMGDADQTEGPGNRWFERNDWPPPSEQTSFYLRQGELLSTEKPTTFESPDAFVYDPQKWVPTLGGRNLNIPAGSYDQRPLESRADVLIYTTPPLIHPLTVVGPITVTLWASSDVLDTDFTAKLCDVYPDGRSMLVADGIIQARHRNSLRTEEFLTPGEITQFTIDLWSTAIVFAPTHRIRLSISSSNYPRFERNPNTGEPFRKNTHTRIAHQTVYHDAEHPSALMLPVTEGDPFHVFAVEMGPCILGQNYPNPFNKETSIPIHFPGEETEMGNPSPKVDVHIYNLLGQCVRSWRLSPHPDDRIIIPWRGEDHEGHPLSSGVYIVRLRFGKIVETRKIILLK